MGTIETSPKPTFQEALAVWAKIGVLSFGGPAGQIALMHRVLVDERRWISEERFLHALNFCMMLPGPEAMQFATYPAGGCTARPVGLSPACSSFCPALSSCSLSALLLRSMARYRSSRSRSLASRPKC